MSKVKESPSSSLLLSLKMILQAQILLQRAAINEKLCLRITVWKKILLEKNFFYAFGCKMKHDLSICLCENVLVFA